MDLSIATPNDMELLGERIAAMLGAGSIVALNGELGAGKTTLTRGIGRALGVRGAVASPTFVLARTHPRDGGKPPLVHVDAYRLSSAAELDDLDLDFDGSIVVVEWSRGWLNGIASSWLELDIRRPSGVEGGGERGLAANDFDLDIAEPRTITLTGHGPAWPAERLLALTK